MDKLCSIIIRTCNEERWIPHCLKAVFSQEYKNFEVIIVDNESIDGTLKHVSQYDIKKVVNCSDYLPGKALNLGIREAVGDYLVFLSGHCIPKNDKWLSSLIRNLEDEGVAGVYGRQEPLAFTSDSDKRDLAVIFGLDKKIQKKDSFFHNANSAIRMDLWKETPFDERITNIEDRLWAEKMLKKGFTLVYEPEASVYHYHGIHQDGNKLRLLNQVKILGTLDACLSNNLHVDIEKLNIIAIIPYKGNIKDMDGLPLLKHTIDTTKQSKFIKEVIVSTDNRETAKISVRLGAKAPFLRDELLSEDFFDTEAILQYTLDRIEESGIFPDLIVYLEITYPFRPANLIDGMIGELVKNGFDSVLAAKRESNSIWTEENGTIKRIDSGDIPRKYKKPTFIGAKGLCCVTHPEFIREGLLLGTRIGIFELNNPYSSIEVRGKEDLRMAERLIDSWTM